MSPEQTLTLETANFLIHGFMVIGGLVLVVVFLIVLAKVWRDSHLGRW